MKLEDFNFSRLEEISENHYLGVTTFGDYVLLMKDKVECDNNHIIDLAESKAKYHNNDKENNNVFIPPVNLFLTEVGLILFDNFATLMILNLEERFMNNELIVIIYTVSLEKARKLHMQLRNEKR